MARILFASVLVVCLLAVLQASPVPAQGGDAGQDLSKGFEEFGKKFQEGVAKAWNDPSVQDFFKQTSDALKNGFDAIGTQIDKVIPKTNSNPGSGPVEQ